MIKNYINLAKMIAMEIVKRVTQKSVSVLVSIILPPVVPTAIIINCKFNFTKNTS